MPPIEKPPCLLCKTHAGVMEALDHIKTTQIGREDTLTRIWKAIESKVSVRVFLSILSVSVAVLGIIVSALFYNQSCVLSSMAEAQVKVLDQITELTVDVGIIKHQIAKGESLGAPRDKVYWGR